MNNTTGAQTASPDLQDKPTDARRELSALLLWNGAVIGEYSSGKSVKPFTIGTADTSGFILPEEFCKFGTFDLLTPGAGGWTVNIPEGFQAGYRDSTGTADSEAMKSRGILARGIVPGAGASVNLANDGVCFIKNGPMQIETRYIAPKQSYREGLLKVFDKRFMTWLLVALFLVIAITVASIKLYRDITSNPEDLNKQINRFVKVVVKEPDKKKEEDVKELKLNTDVKKLDLKKVETGTKKGPTIADVKNREQDRTIALKSGILGAIGTGGSAATNSIFGAGLGSGINNALTGLHGQMIGSTDGLGGMGSRGGGGGSGAMTIGSLGTYGAGKSGRSYGDVSLGGKGKEMESVKLDKLILVGGLEKDVIAKVIQRHWAQIKYCYEKELSKNPNLYGKVVTQFTIGSSGKIDEAHIAQTEMNNEAVESCIVRNIKSWVFPQPKGGGVVLVTYPFIFKSAGQ